MIIPFANTSPRIASDAFVAPDAWIIGDVEMGARSSAFFGVVVRGDILPIRIGTETNLQEHVVVHTSHHRTPAIIGNGVTVGHRAIVHGATVEDSCLIGMGAILLDGAVVGSQSVIGAGTVVTEGMQIPPRSLVLGVPGKVVRTLSAEEVALLPISARSYVATAAAYRGMNMGSLEKPLT